MDVQASVLERYSQGAKTVEPALCCPVDYDRSLLALLPQEIIAKDYGCGDPSHYVKPGDIVLDLGSGAGKICYMAAQLVGERGYVIGVDMNDDMLTLARHYQAEMTRKLGGERVRFVKGKIEDLTLDLAALEGYLQAHPVRDMHDLAALSAWQKTQRATRPLIPTASVDLVISNCVLNLVDETHKQQLVSEIFRVLKPGGRVAISDIISDETIPTHLKNDPLLWSGCISGAFEEQEFLQAFRAAGFLAVSYDKWDAHAWQVVEGIEFRSVTLTAVKGTGTPCLDYGHAVIYRGPFSSVSDDEGHVYPRGARIAVCERSYTLLTEGPYREHFIGIAPVVPRTPTTWCAPAGTLRPASETKGAAHAQPGTGASCC